MKPYNSNESKRDQIKRMFNTIAPRYDLLNHILSFGIDKLWRKRLIKMICQHSAREILDVATGTGDMAITMARANKSAHIVGYDLSEGMLEVARRKVEDLGLTAQISLQQGEAELIPFGDNKFDAVMVAFGVRNFYDLEGGVREMHRVLKSGGKLYILEFSTPKRGLFGTIYSLYTHKILPFVGGAISKDKRAYQYLPESVDEFPSVDKFLELMSRSGFKSRSAISLMGDVAQIYIGGK